MGLGQKCKAVIFETSSEPSTEHVGKLGELLRLLPKNKQTIDVFNST